VAGSVTFDEVILGLVLEGSTLAASDAALGSIGDYGDAGDRGWQLAAGDFITISPDMLRLTFRLTIDAADMAQLRVLTNDSVPEGVGFDLPEWENSFGQQPGGDMDGDRDVDGADFLSWQRNLAAEVPPPADGADVDGDGFVDGRELDAWKAAVGGGDGYDADDDGDSDGADFLAWQRNLTNFPAEDVNRDGRVDRADLAAWEATAGVNAAADADQDGDVDGADFLAWQRQPPQNVAVAAAATVPEPSAIVLGLAVLLSMISTSKWAD
jgi:hypothetical protein